MLAGPRSHGLGTIPAHGPNAPATENTDASISPAASCHQPAHTALSQAVTRREHAQSAHRQPATRSLALPRPPMLTASCGYLWATSGGPEGGGNGRLVPILLLLDVEQDELLSAICLVISLPADGVPAARIMRVAGACVHQVVG